MEVVVMVVFEQSSDNIQGPKVGFVAYQLCVFICICKCIYVLGNIVYVMCSNFGFQLQAYHYCWKVVRERERERQEAGKEGTILS